MDTDLLFVYGTLRRTFPLHHHLKRLGTKFVSAGEIKAELFDLLSFTGARKSNKLGKIVKGELYSFGRPEKALKVLDRVEGFLPLTPEKSLFQRAKTEVTLPNGERRTAWIYWVNERASVTRRVVSGVYTWPR